MSPAIHSRRSLAVLVLVALVLGAVPAAACADGDDCGMAGTAQVPACGGDSCPLAGALGAAPSAADAPRDASFACCSGPELDGQAPALLSTDRSEGPPAPALAAAAPTLGSTPVPALVDATPEIPDRARPGEGAVALHRLHSIDLC